MSPRIAVLVTIVFTVVCAPFAEAGRKSGPGTSESVVAADDLDIYGVEFRGGEIAIVTVRGDGSTDLDLVIVDENGSIVAFDADDTDQCIVSFRPERDVIYRVVVLNHGDSSNAYTLTTN